MIEVKHSSDKNNAIRLLNVLDTYSLKTQTSRHLIVILLQHVAAKLQGALETEQLVAAASVLIPRPQRRAGVRAYKRSQPLTMDTDWSYHRSETQRS